ncbi:MAG TPA: Xaa-Pro peptidase family protein [Pyrinomonadaceae bacterium]|nr:Xaa-Pro peptidase family protein [Pyrinomonadaceae bacterium]
MPRDPERVLRIVNGLREHQLDALICALPINVLLLTGYCPIVGTSIAVITRDSEIVIVAPDDDVALASAGGADEVKSFRSGSLDLLQSVTDSVRGSLRDVLHKLKLENARIGVEYDEVSQPITYAAMHLYGRRLTDVIKEEFASAEFIPADFLLTRLRSVKTEREIGRIKLACEIAAGAFSDGAKQLHAGLTETDAATLFRAGLSKDVGKARADGFVYCMSGRNGAEAYKSYQRSSDRRLAPGDLALIHCNSYVDGYWTDITRTFCIGEISEQKRTPYEAILQARAAALATVRSGVKCADVDRAAREVLRAQGFDREFKHGLGHGAGFEAIDHNAPPRLHPKSTDVLEVGMVFNVEPGLYMPAEYGIRHCDMVALTEKGPELLTPFQIMSNGCHNDPLR